MLCTFHACTQNITVIFDNVEKGMMLHNLARAKRKLEKEEIEGSYLVTPYMAVNCSMKV